MYLFTHGELRVNQVLIIVVLILMIVTFGMYLWGLSHDRALLTRRVLGIKDWTARLLRRSWGDTQLLAFIAELYEGGTLIKRDRKGFMQLVALQMLALLLDCMTLLLLFWSVGVWPHLSVVLLGYSLAYFFSTISSLPGGGGTFEATMAVTITALGVDQPLALSVTLLYRLLAFWLPLTITAVVYRRVHHDRGGLLRRHEVQAVSVRD
ncbi:MAG: flippase-like domain-containing protein [Pseudomonadota bacterium]|nr:flippase-like domain-containing protein [Pseudomonadota bacterium]